MRVFYTGVTEKNAGWGQEWFITRALRHMGVEVLAFDYRLHRYRAGSHIFQMARARTDFDVFVLHKGDTLPPDLVRAIRRPRVYIASDLVARQRAQDQHLSSGLFQRLLVRGNECANAIVAKGWAKPEDVRIFHSGCDPSTHHRVADIAGDIDVLFVGSATPRRRQIIEELAKSFHVVAVRAYGDEMRTYFNRARIVLNLHADDVLDVENRVYEVLGCGAFLLSERLLPSSPFTDGEHLVEFDTVEQCASLIRYYLDHETERDKIADRGYEECHAHHTYAHRGADLLDAIHSLTDGYVADGPAIDMEVVDRYLPCEVRARFLARGSSLVKTTGARVKKAIRTVTRRVQQDRTGSEW